MQGSDFRMGSIVGVGAEEGFQEEGPREGLQRLVEIDPFPRLEFSCNERFGSRAEVGLEIRGEGGELFSPGGLVKGVGGAVFEEDVGGAEPVFH